MVFPPQISNIYLKRCDAFQHFHIPRKSVVSPFLIVIWAWSIADGVHGDNSLRFLLVATVQISFISSIYELIFDLITSIN